MILAAGFGRRLYPLTKNKPKALIKVNNIPMIDHVINSLVLHGFDEIIINLHYLPDLIIDHINKNKYHAKISFSREEEEILNTGGGLKKVKSFFNDKPFLLHNVDVISGLDLRAMYLNHIKNNSIVTIAVKERVTNRYLLFDDNILCGKEKDGIQLIKKKTNKIKRYGFSGIHIIDPVIFQLSDKDGSFSIIDLYLDLCKDNNIMAYIDNSYWIDIGKTDNIKKAEQYLKKR